MEDPVTFFPVWFFASAIVAAVGGTVAQAAPLISFVIAVASTAFVFFKAKVPPLQVPKVQAQWDEHIGKLKSQRASNRALLDS